MTENEIPVQRAVLIGVDLGEYDMEASLEELESLARSAGADVVGSMTQSRDAYDSATCIGSGRLAEAAEFIANTEANLVIFDCELSATQMRNIEEEVGVAVIDRTMLILDIFARRAVSAEGKLQVELAQQQYRLPRLMGLGGALSRLGGGIGTRGPGETQLETDRRHIRRRITSLKEKLAELEKRRELTRKSRRKDGMLVVAVVGYTNAGKSTLHDALTGSGVMAADMLFATLDPTTRALDLPDGRMALLVDTVGLISRLPHHLVEAFASTLEEAAYADLILHVCDAADGENFRKCYDVTRQVLAEIGAQEIPCLTVLNKCDAAPFLPMREAEDVIAVSALRGIGLDKLRTAIARALPETARRMQLLIPYDQQPLLARIRENGKIFSEEYEAEGVRVDALVDIRLIKAASPFAV